MRAQKKSFFFQQVLKPPKQQQNFKAIQSRLEFLRELIDAYSPSTQHGLGMEQTMPMVVLGANSSNAATRTEAIKVWVKLFQTYDRRKIDLHIRSVDSKKTQDLIRAELAGDGVVGDLPPAATPMPTRAKAPAAAKKTPASSAATKGKPSPAAHKSAQKPGGMHLGDQEPADEVERVQWYLTKAKGGDADAQYNLAICYDEGKGTDKNEKEAARWSGPSLHPSQCPLRMALCCPARTSLHACHRRREPRGNCHPAAMSRMSLKIDVLEYDLLQRALAIGRANTRREQVCRGGGAGRRGRPIFSGSSAVKQAQPSVSLSYLCAFCGAFCDAQLR